MNRIIRTACLFTLVNLLALTAAPVLAADTAQIEKLGAVRSRVAAKLNDAQRLTSVAADGISTASSSFQMQYQVSITALNKRSQQESAKAADTRDQAIVDATNSRIEKANLMWNTWNQKEAPQFNQKLGPLQDAVAQIGTILYSLNGLDLYWVRADLDPAQMIAAFASLEKRLDDVITEATPLVENYKKQIIDREHSLQD